MGSNSSAGAPAADGQVDRPRLTLSPGVFLVKSG